MLRRSRLLLMLFGFTFGFATLPSHADNWPTFRGSDGGIARDSADLPAQWSKDDLRWKVKLPGPGTSSPIIVGDKVFLTAYTGYGLTITSGFSKGKGGKGGGKGGKDAGDQKALKLHVLCYDRNDGSLVWKKEIEPKLPEAPFTGFLREHGYASSTPASDGERLYVFFGKTGVFAFDLTGKQLWTADVGHETDKWGSASSPIVYKDKLYVNATIESASLFALDKLTGKQIWKVGDLKTNWTSPVIVEPKDGPAELVMNLPGQIVGYDPNTGKELWTCEGIGTPTTGYTSSTPVSRDGIVYVIGGGGPNVAAVSLAIRAGGKGDVTKTHLLWKTKAGTSFSSPVLTGDHLCWVAGMLNCLDTKTGKIELQNRLYDNRGEYVSAVRAGDKIFALTRMDGLYVLATDGKFDELAHNTFAGDDSVFNASPAVSDGRIFLRSNEYLYCYGKKK